MTTPAAGVSVPRSLPADSHVHSEWSWDAGDGAMAETCARAVELGVPAVAFTEHVDHTAWTVAPEDVEDDADLAPLVTPDGRLAPPAFDAAGYLAAIEECRARFPGLRILSGLELGEPHWHPAAVAEILAAGRFDRVLGSLHCLPHEDGFAEPPGLFARRPAADVLREYLAEIAQLPARSDVFTVLAHIDYPIRSWPGTEAGPFRPADFEEEFRHALRATAATGRALEINTSIPLHADILTWWHEEGGAAVTFGSDAHDPAGLARGFRTAAHLAAAHGFRPGRNPHDWWGRAD